MNAEYEPASPLHAYINVVLEDAGAWSHHLRCSENVEGWKCTPPLNASVNAA